MEPPSGFDRNFEIDKIYLLKKALYGLKQSSEAWFGRFTKTMLRMGYKQSQGDHTLFIKHSDKGQVIALLVVYVDDIIVTENNAAKRKSFRKRLLKNLRSKNSKN